MPGHKVGKGRALKSSNQKKAALGRLIFQEILLYLCEKNKLCFKKINGLLMLWKSIH